MAKKKNKKKRRAPPASSVTGAATIEVEPESPAEGARKAPPSGTEQPSSGRDGGRRGDGGGRGGRPPEPPGGGDRKGPSVAVRRGSFFEIYKRGQGYYTRMGTAIGAGVLILAGANYVYGQLEGALPTGSTLALYLQNGVPVAWVVGLGLLTYWLVGVNRRSCDFMIATEGEMKKVNWSSRRAVIGSTKVVIATVVLMAALLFVVDLLFMFLFSSVGVLQVEGNVLQRLLGLE